jgi:hypothetical protein
MFLLVVVLIIVALVIALAFTRRGNSGERDVDTRGVHDVGDGGAARDNTPRGGNAGRG